MRGALQAKPRAWKAELPRFQPGQTAPDVCGFHVELLDCLSRGLKLKARLQASTQGSKADLSDGNCHVQAGSLPRKLVLVAHHGELQALGRPTQPQGVGSGRHGDPAANAIKASSCSRRQTSA